MAPNSRDRLRDWRRIRDLSSRERSGTFARGQAWERIEPFLRRGWWVLITFPIIFFVVFLPVALLVQGEVRGIVIGASIASGLWFDVLAVIVWTGAATMLMGVSGEASTVDALHELNEKGWRLVNGLKLGRYKDVDHVVVGPGGLLVVESKWSGSAWPVNRSAPRFMEAELNNAAAQVVRNAKEVANWLNETSPSIPVRTLVVLWTGAGRGGTGWETWRDRRTVLVHGSDLRNWLQTELTQTGIDDETVHRMWSLLAQRAEKQDQSAREAGETIAPTLHRFFLEWAVKPTVGLAVAVYTLWLTRFAHDWRIVFAATVTAAVLGVFANRIHKIQPYAAGWVAVSMVYLIAEVVVLMASGFR